MKCIACGEENVQNARFCAFCGAKLSEEPASPAAQEVPPADSAVSPVDETARPLTENPYQPPRAPVILTPSAAAAEPPAETKNNEAEPPREHPLPRQIIKPAPKRVFLFDEEEEDEGERRRIEEHAQKRVKVAGRPMYEDEFEEYDEYDEDEEDIYDEEGMTSGGRIFVRIFSLLTVLILAAALVSFAYGTSVGRRLRASFGLSSNADDYLLLADWQLAQGNASDASDSYYNAFKLEQDDYELSLLVGDGFERSDDDTRAEALYVLLIQAYPQADEPYDRLMALLIRQGRTAEYESLLLTRAERQPGYLPPSVTEPITPTASHSAGAYAAPLYLTLDAGGAPIYYTLDGTTPSASSIRYGGAIVLEQTGVYTIRAVSIAGDLVSTEWSASFVIS